MFERSSKAVKFMEIPQNESQADTEALIPAKAGTKRFGLSPLWPPLCLLAGLAIGAYTSNYIHGMRSLDYRCIRHVAQYCKLCPSEVAQS